MIRKQIEEGWLLIRHQDHARLAGAFASHWGNSRFPAPEPRAAILEAVSRHDDAWAERDASPLLGPDGKPAAFSSELVGTYSAFENIDLEAYLRVRGEATETVARENPYAAILVSMHTVNLLTEQADLSMLSSADLALHGEFVEGQIRRQAELREQLRETGFPEAHLAETVLRRAFEFLQACDSLSLMVCSAYAKPLALRHRHPDAEGNLETLTYRPIDSATIGVEPWPFSPPDSIEFEIPVMTLEGECFPDPDSLDAAARNARAGSLNFRLVPDA